MSWLRTIISRQAVKFFHQTDLDNLFSIITDGIKPSNGQLGFDENMHPIMTYFGVYFGRNESSLARGSETEINRRMILQGWLPINFLEQHGESDADYIYRNDNWYSSNFYPNAPQKSKEEEEYIGDNIVDEEYTWDKSYWQQPYGAAASKIVIPFSWVQNICIGNRWLKRDDALRILEPELNRQQTKNKEKLCQKWELNGIGPREMFNVKKYLKPWDKLQELYAEYSTIKDDISPDAKKLIEEIYAIMVRDFSRVVG